MSQRITLARFLFDRTRFSSPANRATWKSIVAAGAMLGTAYLATPAAADELDEAPPVASAPTAAAAAEVAAAIGRPVRVAQAPEAKKKPPPPAPPTPPAPPPGPPAPPPPPPPLLSFPTNAVDVGTVVAGRRKRFEVPFVNHGTGELKLSTKAITSACACVKVVAVTPAPAGGTGTITLVLTAPKKPGPTALDITITHRPADHAVVKATQPVTAMIDPAPARPRTPVGAGRTGRGFVLS